MPDSKPESHSHSTSRAVTVTVQLRPLDAASQSAAGAGDSSCSNRRPPGRAEGRRVTAGKQHSSCRRGGSRGRVTVTVG